MIKNYKAIICSIMAFAIWTTQLPVTNFQVVASTTKTNQTSTFYYNGDIITVDGAKGETQSGEPVYAKGVLTKDGKIQAVAYNNDELKTLQKKAEEQKSSRVDLKGDTLLPGFFDSHSHLDMVDKYYDASPALGVTTIESLINQGKEQFSEWEQKNKNKLVERTEDDQYWFITHGFDNTAFGRDNYRMPTREDLDAISTEYPIVYIHASDHLCVVNSKALAIFNHKLFEQYKDKKIVNGIRQFWDRKDENVTLDDIEKEDDISQFTGILRENGFFTVFYYSYNLGFDPKYLGTLGDNKEIVAQAIQTYAKNGITTANGNAASVLSQLDDSQKIIDIYNDLSYDSKKDEVAGINGSSVTPSSEAKYNKDHAKQGPIKIFLDGSPQGKTAWFEEDTTDASHGGYYRDENETILDGSKGKEYWWGDNASKISDEELTKEFLYGIKHKLQVVAHANGTAAISQFINSYRNALKQAGIDVTNKEAVKKIGNEVRPVIIHAQTITQKQLKEADELDINLSFFTDHVYYYGDYHLYSTLGPIRGQLISPMKDAVEKHVNVTMHQDSPVAPPNMLFSIFNAANRITRDGQAIGRGSSNGDFDSRITKKINENVKNDTRDERINGYEALKAVTINGAWQNFEENSKGSISVGKEADFVIVNKNPIEEEFLGLSTKEAQKNQFIQETINDDKVIYRAESSNITHNSSGTGASTDTSTATTSEPTTSGTDTTNPVTTSTEKRKITFVSKPSDSVYTGKPITKKLTVKAGKILLKQGTDYTVSYSANKSTGKANVTIKGKGKYTGTLKTSFYIKPKKAVIKSVTGKKKKLTVKVKKNAGNVTGYQIKYSKSSKFKNSKTKSVTKTSYTIKKLTAKKKYYVKVRAYKKAGTKKIYGKWSSIKSKKTK